MQKILLPSLHYVSHILLYIISHHLQETAHHLGDVLLSVVEQVRADYAFIVKKERGKIVAEGVVVGVGGEESVWGEDEVEECGLRIFRKPGDEAE
jgi:hypothetical protein